MQVLSMVFSSLITTDSLSKEYFDILGLKYAFN